MKRKKQLLQTVLITVVGLLLMGVAVYIYSIFNKPLHPFQMKSDQIHKISILSYTQEEKVALAKATWPFEEDEDTLAQTWQDDKPYRVSVVEPKKVTEMVTLLGQIAVQDAVFSQKDIGEEQKDYEVICYDNEGNELQKITFYDKKVDCKKIYELESVAEKDVLRSFCEKNNKPWIDDSFSSWQHEPYANKNHVYYVKASPDNVYHYLYQVDKKGKNVKEIQVKDFKSLIAVTEDKLIYEAIGKDVKYVPLGSIEGANDELKAIETQSFPSLMVTSDILYCDNRYIISWNYDELKIFDFESRRYINTTLPKEKMSHITRVARCGTTTFLITSQGGILVLKEGQTQWQEVVKEQSDGYARAISYNDENIVLCYQRDTSQGVKNSLFCYDIAKETLHEYPLKQFTSSHEDDIQNYIHQVYVEEQVAYFFVNNKKKRQFCKLDLATGEIATITDMPKESNLLYFEKGICYVKDKDLRIFDCKRKKWSAVKKEEKEETKTKILAKNGNVIESWLE